MQTAAAQGAFEPDLDADAFRYRLHCLNRDCFVLPLLKYRKAQGFLVTGQHSGTHWVKWMLSHAMAAQYGVAPPRYYNNKSPESNVIIGHPRHAPVHAHVPRVVSTHSIPAYPLQWQWLRGSLRFPPYVVIVRDIHKVLISNYEKWKSRYNVSFSEYVAGDPAGKRYICDVYWYMRFMNRWGVVAGRFPKETLVLRYEDFSQDRIASMRRISDHFSLGLTAEALEKGAMAGNKDFMGAHHDPAVAARGLRPDGQGSAAFTPQDEGLLHRILDRHLKHDFGYRYFELPRGFQG